MSLPRMNTRLQSRPAKRSGGWSRRAAVWCGIAGWALLHPGAGAQGTGPLSVPARQWAFDAAQNELNVLDYGHVYLRYHMHIKDVHGDRVRDLIQSKEGTVARVIMKEGRPLTPQEDADERGRLEEMLSSPAAFERHIKGDASGKKQAADLIKLLPDAMIFSYTPGQPQRSTRVPQEGDEPEIVIDFKPNPQWSAPTIAADALTGLEGRAWIDARTHYLMRIEGTVFRGVNLGLFLAHIFPGGSLVFEQRPVVDHRWIFTHFVERATVRVLLKTVREDSDMESSDFSQVKEMSYQDAVRVLLATPLPTH